MKKVITLLLISLSTVFFNDNAFASSVKAPNQVDTMIIYRMTYRGTEIRKECWPSDVLYFSPTEVRLGKMSVKIKSFVSAKYAQFTDWFGKYDLHTYKLSNKNTLDIIHLDKSANCYPIVGFSFEGYSIITYESSKKAEFNKMLSRVDKNKIR